MGQTLTHGVYLPDEGERNCYSGLAANWQLLDGAVGTIAEHTTQIAGKAPAVHTHTKADITDFPAYGTTAGTICEGNDSRLSDARTPVAHTHGKADITDLFNSANTWTGEQTFQAQSIYQVNNDPRYVYKSSILEIGVQPTGSHTATSYWLDKNNNELGFTRFVEYDNSTQTYEIRLSNKAVNGALDPTGNDIATNIQLALTPDGVSKLYLNVNSLRPVSNGLSDLGDSTHRWKTLNGINPGALSLPGEYTSSVTEYITDKTGGNNAYTAPADGWVGIQASSATLDSTNFVFMGRTSDGTTHYAQNASSLINAYWSNLYHGCILLPVISGKTYGIRCKCDSVDARFYRANGNVS